MKKISEYINGEALDLLADIIEPAAEIFADKEIAALMRTKDESDETIDDKNTENEPSVKKITIVKLAIKKHKKAIIEILARLNDTPVEEYECNIFSLPATLLEIFNDEGLLAFFTASVRKTTEESGGNATENTEENGK